MGSILSRYIFRVVLGTSLIALLMMLILDSLFNLLSELEDVSNQGYTLNIMLYYLLLTLPQRLIETAPVALLVGGLLGMGALASHSELVVMRASGRSRLNIVSAAMQAGLILSLAVALVAEFVAPAAERMARTLKVEAGLSDSRWNQGLWARDGDLIIHIGAALPGPRLSGLELYALDEQARLTVFGRASGARFENARWVLENAEFNVIKPDAIDQQAVPEIPWHSVLTPETLEVLAVDPEDLALRELLTYIDYLSDNGLDTDNYKLAFWTKVLAPLANLAMLFIAMPFAFSPQRGTGAGYRLMIGIFIGLLFFLLNRMLGNLVLLYHYPPILGAALPMLLLYAAGYWMLRRLR
jgi:lipopolysaccharide export system permease protein